MSDASYYFNDVRFPLDFFGEVILHIFRVRLVRETAMRNTKTLRSYVMIKNGKNEVHLDRPHVANVSVPFGVVEFEFVGI